MIQALFPVRLAKFALMPVLLSFGLLLSVLLPAAVASGCARGTPADAVAPEQQSSDVAAAGQEKPDAAHRAPFDLASGRPMVMMTVNGKGPYPFVFDTGAPGLLLSRAFRQRTGGDDCYPYKEYKENRCEAARAVES